MVSVSLTSHPHPHAVSRCRDYECFDLPSNRDFILFSDDFYSELCSDSNFVFDLKRLMISAKLNSKEIHLKIQISEVTQKAEKNT